MFYFLIIIFRKKTFITSLSSKINRIIKIMLRIRPFNENKSSSKIAFIIKYIIHVDVYNNIVFLDFFNIKILHFPYKGIGKIFCLFLYSLFYCLQSIQQVA